MNGYTRCFLKVLAAVLFSVLIYSCAKKTPNVVMEEKDGVIYYRNTGTPGGVYRPKAELLFELTGPADVPDSISGFGYVQDVITDQSGYIYILDRDHARVKKYDRNGNFERYFPERTGLAVDDLLEPVQFAVAYDTLIVYDRGGTKYLRSLLNGNFLNVQYIFSGIKPVVMKSDGKSNLSSFVQSRKTVEGVGHTTYSLVLLTSKMRKQTDIRTVELPTDGLFYPDIIIPDYALKDGMFYIAENLSGQYRIYVKDSRGILRKVIEKETRPVPYNEYELEILAEFMESAGFEMPEDDRNYYKKSLVKIDIDKKDRLWVQPSMDRTELNQDSLYVDIFEDGAFINRIALNFVQDGSELFKLSGDRIFVISGDRRSVRVYDYE